MTGEIQRVESSGLGIWDFDPVTGEVRADDRAKRALWTSD